MKASLLDALQVARGAIVLCVLGLLGGCADRSARPEPAPATPSDKLCEEVYQDLTHYFDDPDRRRPPGLTAGSFIATCSELPVAAQQCLLFSYVQAHATQCDEILAHAPPDAMGRIAAMTGK